MNKSDAVQTQIRMGRPGVRRNDNDFIPLYVVDRIFGGSYNSRLNTEVRIKKGLTYGANTDFESHLEGGSLMASTFTRTETTMDALRLVVGLFKDMSTGNVKQEELNFARDYMVGVYPIQTETPDEVASHVLTVAHFGLPDNYNETYTNRVAGVTLPRPTRSPRNIFSRHRWTLCWSAMPRNSAMPSRKNSPAQVMLRFRPARLIFRSQSFTADRIHSRLQHPRISLRAGLCS